ncbi:MAG: hypothetical protein AB2689_08605 [Candidatus Thiodiazotropha taylori]
MNHLYLDISKMPYMGPGAFVTWLVFAICAAKLLGEKLFILNKSKWVWLENNKLSFDELFDIPNTVTIDSNNQTESKLRYSTDCFNLQLRKRFIDERNYLAFLDNIRKSSNLQKQVARSIIRPLRNEVSCEKFALWIFRSGDKTIGPWREADQLTNLKYFFDLSLNLGIYSELTNIYLIGDSLKRLESVAQSISKYSKYTGTIKYNPKEIRSPWFGEQHRKKKVESEVIEKVLKATFVNFSIARQASRIVGPQSSYYFKVCSLLSTGTTISLGQESKFNRFFPI